MDAHPQLPPSHICSLRGRQGQMPNPSPDGGIPLLRSLQQPTPSMAGPAALTPASASIHPYASSSATRMSRSSLRLTGPPTTDFSHATCSFSQTQSKRPSSLHPQTLTIPGNLSHVAPEMRDTHPSQHWTPAGQASWQDPPPRCL